MSTNKFSADQLIAMECSVPNCNKQWKWLLKAETDKVLVGFCEEHFKAYWEKKLPDSGPLEVAKYD